MESIKQLLRAMLPRNIQCSEQSELQQSVREFEQHQLHPSLSHHSSKVPSFQHLLNPIKSVTSNADHIKGFRFEINLPFSPYFQLGHTWNIPSTSDNPGKPYKPGSRPSYTITAQAIQSVQNHQPATILMGKMDNDGKLDAFFIKKLAKNISLKISSSFLNSNVEQGMLGADLEIQNKNHTTIFKLIPSLFNFSHMQRITKNLILGFDYSYQNRDGVSFFGYAAKIVLKNHHIFFQYSPVHNFNVAYSIPVRKGTMFVTSFTHQLQDNKTTTVFGLRQKYQNSQMTATINSRGKVSTSLTLLGGEKAPYSLRLCSIVDYMKQTYKFGYGIAIGN